MPRPRTQGTKSLLPVPLALALSLTFVYLAADRSDLFFENQLEDSAAPVVSTICLSELAEHNIRLPSTAEESKPCEAPVASPTSQADLWPLQHPTPRI